MDWMKTTAGRGGLDGLGVLRGINRCSPELQVRPASTKKGCGVAPRLREQSILASAAEDVAHVPLVMDVYYGRTVQSAVVHTN